MVQTNYGQRVAFALHQILVISGRDDLSIPARMIPYLQALDRNAFGQLSHTSERHNTQSWNGRLPRHALSTRTNPNENFAAEIQQLFTLAPSN